MKINNTARYGYNTPCVLEYCKYQCGQTRISMVTEEGKPMHIATVAIPDVHIDDDEVIIKDYSENEGIYNCLVTEGVVHPHHRTIRSGFVELYVCKLTQAVIDQLKETGN